MAKVFISHSSKDKKFVRTLKEDLNENGIDTWIDEDSLDFGDSLIEKIESSLDESSHFMIVLSPNSVQSDWVKLELKKALSRENNPFNKIIPVKYKDCEIPKEIAGLLYGDLSNEVVQVIKDKVSFTTDGYSIFLTKLIKALKTPVTKLTVSDKTKLKQEFLESERAGNSKRDFIANIYMDITGYSTKENRIKFVDRIVEQNHNLEIENIKPIILPFILNKVMIGIKLGDRLELVNTKTNASIEGHFAGFRRDDIKITLPSIIRSTLNLIRDELYFARFDWNEKTIEITPMGN